jgi:hypothetical protein
MYHAVRAGVSVMAAVGVMLAVGWYFFLLEGDGFAGEREGNEDADKALEDLDGAGKGADGKGKEEKGAKGKGSNKKNAGKKTGGKEDKVDGDKGKEDDGKVKTNESEPKKEKKGWFGGSKGTEE